MVHKLKKENTTVLIRFGVNYRYKKSFDSIWFCSSHFGSVETPNKALIIEILQKKHKGYRIELTFVEWIR